MRTLALLTLIGALIGCVDEERLVDDAGPSMDARASYDAPPAQLDGVYWPDVQPVRNLDSGEGIDTGFVFEVLDSGPSPDAGPGRLDLAFPTTVTAPSNPPGLSGGTLLVTRDDHFAVASDPDRDRIVVIGLPTRIVNEIALSPGDEPGRPLQDAAGRVHVVLRRGGAVVTIDAATHTLLDRRAVCPAPRGIAYEAATDSLHVACVGGELVTMPAADGAPTRTLHLDDDLRDVVVVGTDLFITRFRSAELLVVSIATGVVTQHIHLPGSTADGTTASVAWRMIPSPLGGVTIVHQQGRALTGVAPEPGGYGSFGCGAAIVRSAVTEVRSAVAAPTTPFLLPSCAVLAVDASFNSEGNLMVVAAGAEPINDRRQLFQFSRNTDGALATVGVVSTSIDARGRLTSVAMTMSGIATTQTREPAGLWFQMPGDPGPTYVALGGASMADTGFELFHSDVGIGLACASCHPEGGDDGRVWTFDGLGQRRTMALRGGIVGTEPFHWAGELPSFDSLVADVFGGRMSGGGLSREHIDALAHWIDQNPLLPARTVSDPDAVTRGRAVFERADVGCTACHSGARMSNETTVDVGTGGAFQVPSLLGLSYRAPFLHTGCADSLHDRFASCADGDRHGIVSTLTPAQIDDLVAYLQTL